MQREQLQCLCEIMSQGGVNRLRILFGLELRFINPDQFLPFACFFAEAVVGDAIKPGGKFRFPAKAANIFKGFEKRFLTEVIGRRGVAASELPKQTAHGRLMAPNEFREGMLVVLEKDSGDEICIG